VAASPRETFLLVMVGLVGTLAHIVMTLSLRFAPASTLAPMQYIEIPVATFLGWLVFKDLPDALASLGIAITMGAGLGFLFGRYEINVGGGLAIQPDVTVEACKPPDGPSVEDPGCGPNGEIPTRERESPDPQQPLAGKNNQVESPFNAGTYESGYRLFSIGLTTRF